MKQAANLVFLCIFSLALTACAPALSGSDYRSGQVQSSYKVLYGTVIDVKDVKINSNSENVVGTIVGAVAGGVVGNMFGGGKGNTLATIGGALGGAALGNQVEKGIGGQTGQEITVRLDNGSDMVIVQGVGANPIYINQKVKVLVGADGTARVS